MPNYPVYNPRVIGSQWDPEGKYTEDNAIVVNASTNMVGIGKEPAYTFDVLGDIACSGKFGCNGATPQAPYSAGTSASDLSSVISLANNLRAALIAAGICK